MNSRDGAAVSASKRVFAVIPAAGLSRRMGCPKLLLDLGGRPVLSRLLDALNQAGASGIVIVTRRSENQIAEIARQHAALVVQPEIDPPDMRASAQHGLHALGQQLAPQPTDGWLLVPADHPVLEPEVVRALLENWHQRDADILLPTYQGQRGHPTLFRWCLANEVPAIPPDQGINWLVKSKPERVIEVPVASDTVLIDLDTPTDYARLLKRFPGRSISKATPCQSGERLMLTPEEFAAQWGSDPNEQLQVFPADTVQALAIADEDKQFLTQCGLPSSAAPYLEFQTAEDECPTVTEAYEVSPKFARYRIIGGNAEGNPIAIDEQQSGEIVILDQEENFRRTFMNSSIRQLAESLLAYRNMVRAAVDANGENAFFFNQIPPAALETLKQELTRIDASTVATRTFWAQELENLAEPIADL